MGDYPKHFIRSRDDCEDAANYMRFRLGQVTLALSAMMKLHDPPKFVKREYDAAMTALGWKEWGPNNPPPQTPQEYKRDAEGVAQQSEVKEPNG